jgi:hypothetical protein
MSDDAAPFIRFALAVAFCLAVCIALSGRKKDEAVVVADEQVQQAGNIGQSVPDPKYPSHRVYRRRIDIVTILGPTE